MSWRANPLGQRTRAQNRSLEAEGTQVEMLGLLTWAHISALSLLAQWPFLCLGSPSRR